MFVHPPSSTACLPFSPVSLVNVDWRTEDALLFHNANYAGQLVQSFWNAGSLAPFLLVFQHHNPKIIMRSTSGSCLFLCFHIQQTRNQRETLCTSPLRPELFLAGSRGPGQWDHAGLKPNLLPWPELQIVMQLWIGSGHILQH